MAELLGKNIKGFEHLSMLCFTPLGMGEQVSGTAEEIPQNSNYRGWHPKIYKKLQVLTFYIHFEMQKVWHSLLKKCHCK